jgi:hypothetical protein
MRNAVQPDPLLKERQCWAPGPHTPTRSPDTMPILALVLATLTPLALAQASARGTHLSAYPDLDHATADPVLVVAEVAPGEMLPEFEECTRKDVICLHSPLWFRARVSQSIYGIAPARELEVATTSHYGMMDYERSTGPRLVLLLVDGAKVVMPTYAQAELRRRDDGELFLISPLGDRPHWLPCSISTVREEISQKRFRGIEGIGKDAYQWEYVEKAPGLFTILHGKAFPRFGIRLSALQSHLAQIRPDAKQFECALDDGA